jgi:hypothetical protein
MATSTAIPRSEDRPLLRVGGAMTVFGGLTAALGNVLHPRSTTYYDDPAAWLDHNTESSVWFGSHVLILLGTIALVAAMVTLTRYLAGTRGDGIGQLALVNAVIGTIVMLVLLVIDGLVVAELQDVWVAHSEHSPDAVVSGTILYYTVFNLLYVSMMTLFGLAPIFFGVAMLLSRTYSRRFSWVGIVVGSSVFVGALLSMVDVNRKVLDAQVWPVTSTIIVFWFMAIGIKMLRRATASPVSPGPATSGQVGTQADALPRDLVTPMTTVPGA